MAETGQNQLTAEELENRRNKRKRVQRMKTFIVTFLIAWILISMIATVFLVVKVLSLQRQVNAITDLLNGEISADADLVLDGNDGVSEVPDENADTGEEATADVVETEIPTVSGLSDDNLAAENDAHTVCLTFDDGPSANTDAILDILNQYGIKATFFVTGKDDEESLRLYKRIVDEGHTLGMHSYSHSYADIYASLTAFSDDTEKLADLLEETTGKRPTLYRFPGGSNNRVTSTDMSVFIKYLNENGIRYFDWNVSSGDAATAAYSADELVENVTQGVVKYKTSVVLLHDADEKTATVEALPRIIETLQNMGNGGVTFSKITKKTTPVQYVVLSE